jgi:hypothetical protein
VKVKAALFVVLGALALAGAAASGQKDPAQAQKAKCVAACKNDCKKAFETCKKNAGSSSALSACQTSLQTCNANCANKACQ